jgi:hypothetical protein
MSFDWQERTCQEYSKVNFTYILWGISLEMDIHRFTMLTLNMLLFFQVFSMASEKSRFPTGRQTSSSAPDDLALSGVAPELPRLKGKARGIPTCVKCWEDVELG